MPGSDAESGRSGPTVDDADGRLLDIVQQLALELHPGRASGDPVTLDSALDRDLGLDSLDTVDLVVALQKKFDVKIRNDERVRSIRTLGDIYGFFDGRALFLYLDAKTTHCVLDRSS